MGRMRQMMTGRMVRLMAGGLVLCAVAQPAWGQKASNWRVYKMADGLPEPACASVTIGARTRVHLVHPNRLSITELDGYRIKNIPVTEPAIRAWESPSGQLWTPNLRGLLEFRRGAWTLHPISEIAAFCATNVANAREIFLCPVRQGQVVFLLPDRLMEFTAEGNPRTRTLRTLSEARLGRFTGLAMARDGSLWLSGTRGLAKSSAPARSLKPETDWRELSPPPSLGVTNLHQLWEYDDGSITVMADSTTTDEKVLVQFDGKNWVTHRTGAFRVRSAWRGPDRSYWAMTATVLLNWDEGEPIHESEEVSARTYYDVAVEPSGAFWLATSDGLFHCTPPSWRQPRGLRGITTLVRGLTADSGDRLWFVSGGSLHSFQADRHREYPLTVTQEAGLQAGGVVHALKNGLLLLDQGGQLVVFNPADAVYRRLELDGAGDQVRILGKVADGSLCLQNVTTNEARRTWRLALYDGNHLEPQPEPPPEISVDGELLAAFGAQNGDLWVGGRAGTAVCREQKWGSFARTEVATPDEAVCFSEMPDGRIWCATQDKIWEFDGKIWVEIRRGFDRINALLRVRDGSVWLASNSGLVRFYQGAWVANGVEDGLPSMAVRELCEDLRGRIWAGTTHGLSAFHPEADPDPPEAEILQLAEEEKNLPEGGTLNINLTGQDKWKHTTRDRLLFSYRVDERDWSEFTDNHRVALNDLPPGNHYFLARAMDRNCNIDPSPVRLEFSVVLPWFKETRLVIIGSLGVGIALFFAALALNRHRRLVRSYAEVERKVAQRTLELEQANRELLHSQKMTALGTLAAGIAHDFNNILSIVKGSAQIIEDNVENTEKVRSRVDRIKTVVEQGAGIVRAMLGFSRGSGEQSEPCDLNAIARDTVRLLGDRFLREVQVEFEPAATLPEAFGSRDLIQQILLNLILNAAESLSERREIILSTRSMERLPPDLVLAPEPAKSYVSVTVQDFGCGMTPDIQARIFEPFFTTKAFSSRRGTGLGLSMVYELAKKMKAGIFVHSVVQEGSTFTLILPVAEASRSTGAPTSADPDTLVPPQTAALK